MLTLNITGKSIKDSLNEDSTRNENEVKILIAPTQFAETKKNLENLGFNDVLLEDDDGNLFVMASKVQAVNEVIEVKTVKTETPIEIPDNLPVAPVAVKAKPEIIKNSTGVLISCEAQKYKSPFIKKFLVSLVTSRIKPDVIALINGAVKIAAYNSPTCEYLKKLNSEGVKILISDSCSDRIGVTEAVGVGELAEMSEILEEIFSCEKIVNI
ncbi:MAG: hypothetical protein IJP41_06370 [Synergistaceae bacterium]|nr:hypothetical protein [Synergistaceae bacterium]